MKPESVTQKLAKYENQIAKSISRLEKFRLLRFKLLSEIEGTGADSNADS